MYALQVDIEWVSEPPPKKVIDWPAVAAQLREHPGEWALVAEQARSSYVTYINRGKLKGFTAGEFEATGRNNDGDGYRNYDTYARYIGPTR